MSDSKIVQIVKKEKIENMILKLILLVTCIVTIMLNLKEYRGVFLSNDVINDYSNLNSAITNKYKYVTLDLSEAKETRFAFQNDKKEEKGKVYEINYGDYNLLLVLDKNTALTKNVKGELLKENDNIWTIKQKLIEDSENTKTYIKSYFSNMDYSDESNVVKAKFFATISIIGILFVWMILDFIKFMNPKKTRSYRKYVKKMNKM